MPSSPSPTGPPNDQSTTSTSQENTRALLRSLEELRDSLSTRVEQLSGAVDRLRSQAGELERALEGDWTNRPDGAVQSENVNTASAPRTPPTAIPAPAPAGHGSAIEPTTAISREISSLAQPISTDDIAILLDRASQLTSTTISNLNNLPSRTPAPVSVNVDPPADGNGGTSDSWMIRAQTIENRIRRLSETARELRQRATQSLDTPVIAPAPAPAPAAVSIAQRFGLGEGWREEGLRNFHRHRPASYGSGSANTDIGSSRSLARIREDQERLESNIRRLNNIHEGAQRLDRNRYTPHPPPIHAQRRHLHSHIPHVVVPPAMTRRNKSNIGGGVSGRGRYPRSHGMPPTNVEVAARQPAPQVIRSTPVSSLPTVTSLNPEQESSHITNIAPSNGGNTRGVDRNAVTEIDLTSDSPSPTTRSQNVTEGNNPMRGLARAIVDAARTSPSRAVRNPPDARDDGLTYRGMTVASRMDSNNVPARAAPTGTTEQWSMSIEAMLPALRRLLDIPGLSSANLIESTEIGGENLSRIRARTHREVSIPPVDESPMEETVRLLQPSGDATQGLDETWTFTITDAANAQAQAPPPDQDRNGDRDFRWPLLDLDDGVSRTRTIDYTAALGGRHGRATSPNRLPTAPEPLNDGANAHIDPRRTDISVFIDFGQGRVLPLNQGIDEILANPNNNANGDGMNRRSGDMTLPRPRSREDIERLRAERQAAIDRLERSRSALRGMQRFRRQVDNSPGDGEGRGDSQMPTVSANENQSREDTDRLGAERQAAAINRLERSRASLGQMQRLRREMNVDGEGGANQTPTWSLQEIQSRLRTRERESRANADDEEGRMPADMGTNMEVSFEFGPTPTQGTSAAGALDNFNRDRIDLLHVLGLDDDYSMVPSPRTSEMPSTVSAPPSDDEDGDQMTVYEATGEGVTVRPGGRRNTNTPGQNTKTEDAGKERAPKENNQSGLHCWPGTNVVSILAASDTLMSRESRATYRSMTEL